MILTVAMLKGGTGKTTTAVHIAYALRNWGTTLLIDTDDQGSTLDWAEPLNIEGVVISAPNIHTEVLQNYRNRFDHVVIDCPPKPPEMTRSALLCSDAVLMPTGSTRADLGKIRETVELIDYAQTRNDRLHDPLVLLYGVKKVTLSRRAARKDLTDYGVTVLDKEIFDREHIAQTHGLPIVPRILSEFEEVIKEIEERINT